MPCLAGRSIVPIGSGRKEQPYALCTVLASTKAEQRRDQLCRFFQGPPEILPQNRRTVRRLACAWKRKKCPPYIHEPTFPSFPQGSSRRFAGRHAGSPLQYCVHRVIGQEGKQESPEQGRRHPERGQAIAQARHPVYRIKAVNKRGNGNQPDCQRHHHCNE